MNSVAANHTVPGTRPPRTPLRAWVEDLNWPVPGAPSDKKPARRVGVRVPGRDVDWLGTTPTLQ